MGEMKRASCNRARMEARLSVPDLLDISVASLQNSSRFSWSSRGKTTCSSRRRPDLARLGVIKHELNSQRKKEKHTHYEADRCYKEGQEAFQQERSTQSCKPGAWQHGESCFRWRRILATPGSA